MPSNQVLRAEQQRRRRANRTAAEIENDRRQNTIRRQAQRANQTQPHGSHPIEQASNITRSSIHYKGFLHTNEIYAGNHQVTRFSLGLRQPCQFCGALLWSHERTWTTICCLRGTVQQQPWTMPAQSSMALPIHELWMDQGPTGNLFRRYSRKLNNALALASQSVQEEYGDGGWQPNLKIQGRLYHRMGPLQPMPGATPRFSQIYIHDPQADSTEASIRLGYMELESNVTDDEKISLLYLLEFLQFALRQCNRYIQDFLTACEIPEDQIENQRLVINADAKPPREHAGRYNRPEGWQEVAILMGDEIDSRDIILRRREGGLSIINERHRAFDALHFILLFPEGENCWDLSLYRSTGQRLSTRQYYAFHLHERSGSRNSLLYASRLFQEYCCMAFAKVESLRLFYLETHQLELRADLYQSLHDAIRADDHDHNAHVGQRVILPASFKGGPRDMHRRYQDAMAIVRTHGKPDLFVTMTCNPDWPDIQRALLPGQHAKDRPDIVARVFKGHLKQLIHEITKEAVFGKAIAHLYVIEFQKRGLPHAHILVILATEFKLRTPELIDGVVCAELPDNEELRHIVCRSMIHNACGIGSEMGCMKNDSCSKHFPKAFADATIWREQDTHPMYRRRAPNRGGRTEVYGGHLIDNSWVVPYNPYLTLRFNCHINVEVCNSIKACKYLFKYIYKGHDRAMVHIHNANSSPEQNEIDNFKDLRSIGSSEACWRLYQFDMSDRSPAVISLPVHLENQQRVYFQQSNARQVARDPPRSQLMAWFDYNQGHLNSQEEKHLYYEFLRYFTWDDRHKSWRARVRNQSSGATIGRVHSVHPSAGELFYFRMLLHNSHAKGKPTFSSLRHVNGIQYDTFKEACQALHLLADDAAYNVALEEATLTHMSAQIRQTFAILLEFCNPANPALLFEHHCEAMTEDFQLRFASIAHPLSTYRAMALLDIELLLEGRNLNLLSFSLPEVDNNMRELVRNLNAQPLRFQNTDVPEIQAELDFNIGNLSNITEDRVPRLLPSQRYIFDQVLQATSTQAPLLAFVDAPGGTGKTFSFNTILAAIRAKGQIALPVATSGVAAIMLDGGRTFHSRFKAPLIPEGSSTCNIPVQSNLAKLFRQATIIIWDEAPMAHRYLLEALDRTLQDIMQCHTPFGGKSMLLGGDFRQVLPVVKRASRRQVVDASIKQSPLWPLFQKYRLQENMRLRIGGVSPEAESYAMWVLQLGNGTLRTEQGKVKLLTQYCIQGTLGDLIAWTFPNLPNNYLNNDWMLGRAILAPLNSIVDEINATLINSIPTMEYQCLSADRVVDEDNIIAVPIEFLNTLKVPGFPLHDLRFKIGMPLLLLRTLNPTIGLCNGSRLILERVINKCLLQVRILTTNQIALIPRIPLRPTDALFPFTWERLQFPVAAGFGMTINKAQGQTLSHVGVHLLNPVFTHGQLYVAASRVSHPNNIRFLISPGSSNMTHNVVYTEAL